MMGLKLISSMPHLDTVSWKVVNPQDPKLATLDHIFLPLLHPVKRKFPWQPKIPLYGRKQGLEKLGINRDPSHHPLQAHKHLGDHIRLQHKSVRYGWKPSLMASRTIDERLHQLAIIGPRLLGNSQEQIVRELYIIGLKTRGNPEQTG